MFVGLVCDLDKPLAFELGEFDAVAGVGDVEVEDGPGEGDPLRPQRSIRSPMIVVRSTGSRKWSTGLAALAAITR